MSNLSKKSTSRSKTAQPTPALSFIKDIHRQTRRQYTAEEKIRFVLEGLQGEQSVAEICPVLAFLTEGLNRGGGPHHYLLSLDWTAEEVASIDYPVEKRPERPGAFVGGWE